MSAVNLGEPNSVEIAIFLSAYFNSFEVNILGVLGCYREIFSKRKSVANIECYFSTFILILAPAIKVRTNIAVRNIKAYSSIKDSCKDTKL